MIRRIPSASLLENLWFNLFQVVPNYLKGLFVRNRFWTGFWSRLQRDATAVRFVGHLKKRHGSNCIYLRMLTTRTLLVLDEREIRRVLDNSPILYAEPKQKREGMSHFQPGSVTISRGAAWRLRREFNERVLETGSRLHRFADTFLKIIREEVADVRNARRGGLDWRAFQGLFDKIALQIIFGRRARNDGALSNGLTKLMREANRVFRLRKSRHFDGFYERVRSYLNAPEERSLVWLCRESAPSADVRIENQVPHWLFAMRDTLAENVIRALAIIVADPQVQRRVREELSQADLASPQGIDELRYLEGCLQEAMRLWPTTPMIVRQSVHESILAGVVVPRGCQVLILNASNHRRPEDRPFSDTFDPEFWRDRPRDDRYNHLSNGPQVCAGLDLALFVAKGVLASLLNETDYELRKPKIASAACLPDILNHFAIRFDARSH